MKILAGFIFGVIIMVSAPVYAASHCYSMQEANAEQLLRLHSELMVVTVTCHQGSQGEDLVKAYTGFTRDNIKVLREAEQIMMRYYEKTYGGDGTSRLDTLRTKLANQYGQKIANVSAPIFCGERRDKVVALHKASTKVVHDEMLKTASLEKTYVPLCSENVQTAQKAK